MRLRRRAIRRLKHSVMRLFLRVTLLLLAVSVRQVSAGAHCDFQTGAAAVVGHGELHLPSYKDALKDATLGANATDAALGGQ